MIHIVRKSTPRFTKSPSLVLIGPVWTEIQAFKNVKKLQRNVRKCGQIRICPNNRSFYNPDSGWSRDQRNQSLSSNVPGGRGERAWIPLLFPRRKNLVTRLQQPESFTFSGVTLKLNQSFTGHQLHLSQRLLEIVKTNAVCRLSVLVPSHFLQQALGPIPHSEDVCQSMRQNKAK